MSTQRSTAQGGPNVVQDGLVLYLDAANHRSYISGSTTWNDLTQYDNDGILISGPTFSSANGGSIVFDGSDDYVARNVIDTGQNFTAAAWIRPTTLGRGSIIGNSFTYIGRNGWILGLAANFIINGNFFISVGADTCLAVSNGGVIVANNWNYVTVTVSNGGNTIKLYKNGIETSYDNLTTSSGTITYTSNEFNIGYKRIADPEPFSGNISAVKIYNRTLSDQEVLQNYNALKARYNL